MKMLKSVLFISIPVVGLIILLGSMGRGQVPTAVVGNVTQATDDNIAPNVFETNLEATEAIVDIGDGNGAVTKVYAFNGKIPGPRIRVKVGDTVIVHFTNSLPEATSIHWHGVEVNNESDGSSVSQNMVPPNGSFTYKFQVRRPGIFWYHPHFTSTNQVFKGMYGPFIVTDDTEQQLIDDLHILPPESHTHSLVLSDITVCKSPGTNDTATFPPGLPWVGGNSFLGHTFTPNPKDLCENSPRNNEGMTVTGSLAKGTVPYVFPGMNCTGPGGECRVNEGQIVLVNGLQPGGREGSPNAPGALVEPTAKVLDVKSGGGLRLQIINAAITRYFRLRLSDGTDQPVTLFRVGGEGGLLDRVRVEGGAQGSLDTKYSHGEILLTPSDRADIVIKIPDGNIGDILTLWTQDYPRNGPRQGPFANIPTVPILHLRIIGPASSSEKFSIAENQGLLANPTVNRPIENIKNQPIFNHLLNPTTLSPVQPGTANETIQFNNNSGQPTIDGIVGNLHGASGANFQGISHLDSSRYARVGDLLELKVTNLTQAHHPFHLHGFSFQPVRIEIDGVPNYTFDYEEFVDTVDIQPIHTLVYRVRLDDRKMKNGLTLGGAVGRWLFHCHIFHHAEMGKTAELVVLPALSPLMWRNTNTGAVAVWLMNGTARASAGFPGSLPLVWQIALLGDVNGDGKADVIWRNTSNGAVAVWLMNGTTVTSSGFPGGATVEWAIAGAGDVDGDGKSDLIWRNSNTGQTTIWLMNGTTIASTGFPGGVPLVWQIAEIGDVNGDGKADVIWRNTINGAVAVWLMNGTTVTSTGFPGGPSLEWTIAGAGDVNGDGKTDLVWRNTGNGSTAIWLMNGTAIASSGFPGGVPLAWQIAQVGDMNGDTKTDVIWRNASNGAVSVWLMNGLSISSSGFPGSAPMDWEIQ